MGQFWPENIEPSLCDVVYYGYGNIHRDSYEVCSWDPVFDLGPQDAGVLACEDEGQVGEHDGIRRTLDLKKDNPDMKILYSVGSWNAGGLIFSEMVKTQERRISFIASVTKFLNYFGFDGLDLDWQYPCLDQSTGQPTDPEDKIRLTALVEEIKTAFAGTGLILSMTAAAEPLRAEKYYELDKLPHYVDWFNILSFDYSGFWDGFTGLDQPLYGKWDERFPGLQHFQLNIHDTVQFYLSKGVSASQLNIGIHTGNKAFRLVGPAHGDPGVYCPAIQAPPLPFSQIEGWLTYYEVLQLLHNDTIQCDGWEGVEPGLDHWVVHDHDHGNIDKCYLAPYAYQGEFWISYEDPSSVGVKMRYANQYGLLGAFIYTIESDDFIGLFGQKKFGLLSAMNDGLESGDELSEDEIHGAAMENMVCGDDYARCRASLSPTQSLP